MMPASQEEATVKWQLEHHAGIFGCDEFAVLSQERRWLGQKRDGAEEEPWTCSIVGSSIERLQFCTGSEQCTDNMKCFARDTDFAICDRDCQPGKHRNTETTTNRGVAISYMRLRVGRKGRDATRSHVASRARDVSRKTNTKPFAKKHALQHGCTLG